MIHPLILSGILLYISGAAGFNTLKLNITVKHRSSGIIPLRWDRLKTSYYWCAVEIGGYDTLDAGYYLYLKVQSAPDVSVVSNSVSGHEGGNVSVQCFYSSGYQNKLKQWCRIKDQSCYTVGRTDTSQNPSVQISDNVRRRSFTVLMTGLRLSDSGWFFCSVGELQVPVQLFVQRDNKYKKTTESDKSSDDADPSSDGIFLLLWTAVPLLLLLMLVLVIWRIIQKCNLPTQGPDVCSETETTVMYEVFKKVKDNEQKQQVSLCPSRAVLLTTMK